MPHLLLAAPSIGTFRLHDLVAESAMRRGHRVSVLAVEPAQRTFWLAQGLPVHTLPCRGAVDAAALPLRELAEVDCRLLGQAPPDQRQRDRAFRRLRRQARDVLGAFAHDPPDVVLMHQGRSGLHRLVHFVARRLGVGVVHLGDGLLPSTMLCDPDGVDGDSSLCRRASADYRGVGADSAFLRAALASWLGDCAAPAALRRPPNEPALLARLHDAARVTAREGLRAGMASLHAWRAALPAAGPAPGVLPRVATSGSRPEVVVLLQSDRCARVRLDAPTAARAAALLHAARAAVTALDAGLAVIGVLPEEASAEQIAALLASGCPLVPHGTASAVLATALAVVTINHPLAGAALLHGTPVVHVGRAIYGVPGVTVSATLHTLRDGIATALAQGRPSLRERFLTRVLQRDHVWCSAERPDRNGVLGVLQAVERLLHPRAAGGGSITYRPGPAWPMVVAP